MQHITPSGRSPRPVIHGIALACTLVAISAAPGLAGPHGGGGGGGGRGGMGGFGGASGGYISARGMANTNGPNSADRDFGRARAADRAGAMGHGHGSTHSRTHGGSHGGAGGASRSHMSAQGLANTNGPNAADRDFGAARAADRAHQNGGH